MTLDQMRVLIAVAELGSFSAAGRRLSRVQSAISQTIGVLEGDLKLELFDRSGKKPVLTEAGKAILEEARDLLHRAERLRARADAIARDVEPEMTLAADAMFPEEPMMASLKAFSREFPTVPVTLFTENLGGPEYWLREGGARLGLYAPRVTGIAGLESEYLVSIPLIPVVAADHPLAALAGPVTRDDLLDQVQLVLTDRTSVSAGGSIGVVSNRIWRFADIGLRLKYLLAGFGWCNMPSHLVETHIAAGRLKRLVLKELGGRTNSFPIHAIYQPGRAPGRAGRWLIDDLKRRLHTE